jgi:hypothetical protein
MQFKINVNCRPGDNPVQSKVCSHIGVNGNQLCQKCHAGGTCKVQESDEGFHSLFEVGDDCISFLVLTRLKYPAW